jgi:hypothetical protein
MLQVSFAASTCKPVEVFVHDPEVDQDEAMHEYDVRLLILENLPRADAIGAAVSP